MCEYDFQGSLFVYTELKTRKVYLKRNSNKKLYIKIRAINRRNRELNNLIKELSRVNDYVDNMTEEDVKELFKEIKKGMCPFIVDTGEDCNEA